MMNVGPWTKRVLLGAALASLPVSCSDYPSPTDEEGQTIFNKEKTPLERISEQADRIRSAHFEERMDEDTGLIVPNSKSDVDLEARIDRAIEDVRSLEGYSVLEKMMIFKLSMLGHTEFMIGDVALGDNLGTRQDGKQAGQNIGGIVSKLAKETGRDPDQWCSLFVIAADALFLPDELPKGARRTMHPFLTDMRAKRHINEAKVFGAFHDVRKKYQPKMGDRLIFDTADPNGSRASGHIATVLHYDPESDLIITVDGNSNLTHCGTTLKVSGDGIPKLPDGQLVRTGGAVGVNYYTLQDLKQGVSDVNDPEKVRSGTLVGIIDTEKLARQTLKIDISARDNDLYVPHQGKNGRY